MDLMGGLEDEAAGGCGVVCGTSRALRRTVGVGGDDWVVCALAPAATVAAGERYSRETAIGAAGAGRVRRVLGTGGLIVRVGGGRMSGIFLTRPSPQPKNAHPVTCAQ